MPHFPDIKNASDAAVPLPGAKVIDINGRQAQIASIQTDADVINTVIRFDKGQEVILPVSVLALQPDGVYHVPFAIEQLPAEAGRLQTVIPVLQEQLQVGKRSVDTGKGVRLHKAVTSREQVVDVPLMQDVLDIKHVPVERIVSGSEVPVAHYEGDTLVVPVLEEVLVVQKQLRFREEVRITRRRHEVHAPQTVIIKEEQVSIEHFDERNDVPGQTDNGVRPS